MAGEQTIFSKTPPRDGRNWECQCARCGSSVDFVECDSCHGHRRGCGDCGGSGGSWQCLSSVEWCRANPLAACENVERGLFYWFIDKSEVS